MRTASNANLLLMTWLSPQFPVGAFAYSHGLEQAHAEGDVHDADSLHDWLEDLLQRGSLRNDAILLAMTWRAATRGDDTELRRVNELAIALAGSTERRLETTGQGSAFLIAIARSWHNPAFARQAQTLESTVVAYPIAVAMAAAAHDVDRARLIESFALAWLANLTSAATRLGAVGQTAAQNVLQRLLPAIPAFAAAVQDAEEDDLGGSTLRSEIAAMRHETLYSRLFRS